MGMFTQRITIADLQDQQSVQLDAVVDTGAFYSVVPGFLLRQLGVEVMGTRLAHLADGSQIEMEFGQVWLTLGDERLITIVLFGNDIGQTLLGAFALEGFALAVDPVNQRLVSVDLILA
ncbi:MAG: hypothetical protein F4102_01255 [Chloroflexi bacterium]|nr:hypothetical protein [Chloroflexota bacterium]